MSTNQHHKAHAAGDPAGGYGVRLPHFLVQFHGTTVSANFFKSPVFRKAHPWREQVKWCLQFPEYRAIFSGWPGNVFAGITSFELVSKTDVTFASKCQIERWFCGCSRARTGYSTSAILSTDQGATREQNAALNENILLKSHLESGNRPCGHLRNSSKPRKIKCSLQAHHCRFSNIIFIRSSYSEDTGWDHKVFNS